jgi:hypothetical protein
MYSSHDAAACPAVLRQGVRNRRIPRDMFGWKCGFLCIVITCISGRGPFLNYACPWDSLHRDMCNACKIKKSFSDHIRPEQAQQDNIWRHQSLSAYLDCARVRPGIPVRYLWLVATVDTAEREKPCIGRIGGAEVVICHFLLSSPLLSLHW